jgi:hypothetical protein
MGEYAFLAVYRSSYGMSWEDLGARGNGMAGAWLILGVEWMLFMALAWYLEQVRVCCDGLCCAVLCWGANCRDCTCDKACLLFWRSVCGVLTATSCAL